MQKGSFRIGRAVGIPIYVHWTYLLILGVIGFMNYNSADASMVPALRAVAMMAALSGCVILHELGHALAAMQFGIRTRDITMLPIGGLARLERMPEKPMQELWVAIAGPLVNVGIAAFLFGVLSLRGHDASTSSMLMRHPFLLELMIANVVLVVFNMIPAFPMDGGRVLRAILAMMMDYTTATVAAARVGQAIALLFGIGGLYMGNFILVLIAFFVFSAAGQEANSIQTKAAFRGLSVRDAMIRQFQTLPADQTLSFAAEQMLSSDQTDFPVIEANMVVGVLTRNDLVKGIAEFGRDAPISLALSETTEAIQEDQSLESALTKMRGGMQMSAPVFRGNQFVGLLSLAKLHELLMIRSALREWRAKHA